MKITEPADLALVASLLELGEKECRHPADKQRSFELRTQLVKENPAAGSAPVTFNTEEIAWWRERCYVLEERTEDLKDECRELRERLAAAIDKAAAVKA